MTVDEAEAAFARGEITAQRLFQVRNRAAGLCHLCKRKATRGVLCGVHAKKQAKRRQDAGASKARCKKCNGLGHYQKTCNKE